MNEVLDRIISESRAEGFAEGFAEGVTKAYRKLGYTIPQIAQKLEISVEEVNELIAKYEQLN